MSEKMNWKDEAIELRLQLAELRERSGENMDRHTTHRSWHEMHRIDDDLWSALAELKEKVERFIDEDIIDRVGMLEHRLDKDPLKEQHCVPSLAELAEKVEALSENEDAFDRHQQANTTSINNLAEKVERLEKLWTPPEQETEPPRTTFDDLAESLKKPKGSYICNECGVNYGNGEGLEHSGKSRTFKCPTCGMSAVTRHTPDTQDCVDCNGTGKEICDNPDHGFIDAIGGETSRLGCPGCGHDPDHFTGSKCETCGGTGKQPDTQDIPPSQRPGGPMPTKQELDERDKNLLNTWHPKEQPDTQEPKAYEPGYSQETVDALTKERDALQQENERLKNRLATRDRIMKESFDAKPYTEGDKNEPKRTDRKVR